MSFICPRFSLPPSLIFSRFHVRRRNRIDTGEWVQKMKHLGVQAGNDRIMKSDEMARKDMPNGVLT
jgi:hypothetical protein